MFENIEFLNKELFWMLLLIPIALVWYVFKHNKQTAELKISSTSGFKTVSSFWPKFKHLLFVFRLIALGLLITALARPRTVDVSTRTKTTRGIDIVMAIDVSASMLAKDLRPNRLEGNYPNPKCSHPHPTCKNLQIKFLSEKHRYPCLKIHLQR